MHRRLTALGLLTGLFTAAALPASAQGPPSRLDLSLEPDQARAILAILTVRAAGDRVPDSLWTRVHEAEGYRRVMERERGINEMFGVDRGIDDPSFRAWALSDAALEELEGRQRALAAWEAVDLESAGARALAYLPARARLRGTIYPIVREQQNSFIWDAGTENPAIFMYVEPGKGAAELEHTLAHELHHIGLAMACPAPTAPATPEAAEARRWLGGLGEGLAVLAAAGGPDGATHPHDPPELRDAWAARLDSLEHDIAELEDFVTAILDGRLSGDDAGRRGMTFLNRPGSPQAAFYTVGWHMAATLERERGRGAVVAAVCDPARLVLEYQEIATHGRGELPAWSAGFIERIRPLAAAEEPGGAADRRG
jgi:hypothetical protein